MSMITYFLVCFISVVISELIFEQVRKLQKKEKNEAKILELLKELDEIKESCSRVDKICMDYFGSYSM